MFRSDRSPQRDTTDPGSKSSGKREQSPSKRGELGVKFAQYHPEQQKGEAQIAAETAVQRSGRAKIASTLKVSPKVSPELAAVRATQKSKAKRFKAHIEEEEIKRENKIRDAAADALLDAPGELAAAMREDSDLAYILRDDPVLAAIRATRPDIVKEEKYMREEQVRIEKVMEESMRKAREERQ